VIVPRDVAIGVGAPADDVVAIRLDPLGLQIANPVVRNTRWSTARTREDDDDQTSEA
jgi:hypothetical protein